MLWQSNKQLFFIIYEQAWINDDDDDNHDDYLF